MMVLFHVVIALLSIGYTTYLFFVPSKKKFYVNYALVALTITSGTYLVWSKPAHIAQACMTGLFYIGFVSVGMAAAQYRLVAKKLTKV
jgi:hypothetical protein